VSQNTVRDALRILEHDGLVVKRPRLGVYVRAFTLAEADEVYTLWAAVEGIALGWAAGRMNADTLDSLRAVLADARRNIPAGPARGFIDAVFTIHQGIAQASGGSLTQALLNTLHNQGRLLEMLRQMRSPRGFNEQAARLGHCVLMLDAIETGDAKSARAALSAALDADRTALKALLE
jgi:DNA-binding GntR family transcriptional regulator